MIQLNCDKEQLLADIAWRARAGMKPVTTPADPRFFANDQIYLVARVHTAGDILPPLRAALVERLVGLPRKRLDDDLIVPLRRGLGNAVKRGNRSDPSKWIIVEAVVTKLGVFLSVSDEGDGFDAALVLQRFRAGEQYGTGHGSGFASYEKARSLISFADGGRTLLIRYLRTADSSPPRVEVDCPDLGWAGNLDVIRPILVDILDDLCPGATEVESCHIEMLRPGKGTRSEILYTLEHRARGSDEPRTTTLTGRLLSEARARRDMEAAEHLRPLGGEELSIPRPVAVVPGDPQLVLFECNPSMDLRDYLRNTFDPEEVTAVVRQVAAGLRRLHGSQPHESFGNSVTVDDIICEADVARTRVIAKVAEDCPPQLRRCRQVFDRLLHPATLPKEIPATTTHGAYGWNCVLYGDERFYLFRFDRCHLAHPGLDVAGFLVDLLRFYVLRNRARPEFHDPARDAFLDTYFAGEERWREDLPFFTAFKLLQLVERVLQRHDDGRVVNAKIDALLERCERLLE